MVTKAHLSTPKADLTDHSNRKLARPPEKPSRPSEKQPDHANHNQTNAKKNQWHEQSIGQNHSQLNTESYGKFSLDFEMKEQGDGVIPEKICLVRKLSWWSGSSADGRAVKLMVAKLSWWSRSWADGRESSSELTMPNAELINTENNRDPDLQLISYVEVGFHTRSKRKFGIVIMVQPIEKLS
jgi:hypothetical protein